MSSKELRVCSFIDFIKSLEREEDRSKWSSGLEKFSLHLETLEGFLDGHVADIHPERQSKEQNQYLADVTQEKAERLTRGETALDQNTLETREKWTTAQVNNHTKVSFHSVMI